ncbi:hypothetical protein [Kitasatospora cineracea]|uniref:hypothetical protein n=1 Tax=Kitasatospora cineracea TaxID=88074 RepID=UPI0036CB6FB3
MTRPLPTTVTLAQMHAALRALGLDPRLVVGASISPEGVTVTVNVRDHTGHILAQDDDTAAEALLFVPVVPELLADEVSRPGP